MQDERGSLPLLGMATLGSSAVFVAWRGVDEPDLLRLLRERAAGSGQ